MKKQTSNHSDEWKSHFRGISAFVGRSALNVLGEMAPAIRRTTITLPSDVMRESKTFITKTRSQINYQAKALARNINGRQASNILSDAMSDIQNGTHSFERISNESDDMADDFDDYMDRVDSEVANSDDPSQAALAESKKNSAMVGKAIAQGNSATIKGIENMTDVLSNVVVKTSNANFMRSQNTTLMGINQMNAGFHNVTGRLDIINENIISMLNFQRDNVSVLNQQTMQFQAYTMDMMDQLGEGIAELRDFIQYQRDNIQKQNTFRNSHNDDFPLDFKGGINFDDLKSHIKKNAQNNVLLSVSSMVTSFLPMMLQDIGTSKGMKEMLTEKAIKAMIPKNIRNSIKRTDKMFGRSMEDLLYRVGDLKGSDNMFLQTIGQLFGLQKSSFKGPNVADFKRDAMSWNGIAQKTLVTVIPNYLARIESAITGREERYYNMDKGKFQTRTRVGNEYKSKLNNDVSMGMDSFKTKFRKTIANEADRDELMEEFSKIVEDQITSGLANGNMSKTRQEMIKHADRLMHTRSNVDTGKIYDMIIELTDNIDDTLQQLSRNFNSAQENLFNDEERSTREYFKLENVFTEKYKTSQGLRYNMLNEMQKQEEIQKKRFAKYMEKYVATNGELWKNLNAAQKWQEAQTEEFMRAVMDKSTFDQEGVWKVNDEDASLISDLDDFGSVAGGIGRTYVNIKKAIKNSGKKRGKRTSGAIDKVANFLYRKTHGLDYYGDITAPLTATGGSTTAPIAPTGGSSSGAASSNHTQRSGTSSERTTNARRQNTTNSNADLLRHDATEALSNPNNFNNIINSTPNEIARNSQRTNRTINRVLGGSAGNGAATIGEASIEQRMLDDENSMTAMVLSMHNNVLAPMAGGVFGKNGVIANFFSTDNMKNLRDKLFDEKTGPLGGVTVWFKDKLSEMGHFFTGKGYYDSKNQWHDEKTDSVFDKLSEGYNFIYENTMKHIFGEDYKENDTFQKFFSWADWKNKRQAKREKRMAAHDEEVKEKERTPGNAVITDERFLLEDKQAKRSSTGTAVITDPRFLLEDKQSKKSPVARISSAIQTVEEKILDAGETLTNAIVGPEKDIEKQQQDASAKSGKTFMEKAKKFLPAGVAAGIAGAAFGALNSGGGLISGLILPTGPIGGAAVAIGLAMLAKNQKFTDYVFGKKDADGKREGGMVTKRAQEAFKKSLPLVVGASSLGAIKGVIKSAFGMGVVPGPGGFLLNALGPGGAIGGAMLGLGVGLLRNNESFKNILWGKEGEDGKRTGGFFGKQNERFKKFMEKNGHFAKGGLKGLGIGGLTGAVMSQAGILGSALSFGGPIGMGVAGLGIGIASQTEKFKELLFGTMEYDSNGNPIERKGDGLLSKARNMLVMHVFEPIKDTMQNQVNQFAFWLRDNLVKPFRTAFGPILETFDGVRKDIHEIFMDLSNKIGDTMKKGLKTIFSPFTKIVGKLGQGLATGLRLTAQASLFPITAPLKVLSATQAMKRAKARVGEGTTLFEALGDITSGIVNRTREDWANDDRDYGKGPFGGINKLLTRGRDIFRNTREGFDAAAMGYEDEMTAQGKNIFGWMGEAREARRRKYLKKQMAKDVSQWNKINAVRRGIASENNYAEVAYSDAGLKSIKNRLKKAGVKSEYIDMINSNQDLNQLLYHRDEFKDRLLGKEKKKTTEEILKDGITVRQDPGVEQENLNYHDKVISRFDTIVQAVTKLTAERELSQRKNVSAEELARINNRLAAQGVKWDDLNVDLMDIVDYDSFDGASWDYFMRNSGEAIQKNDTTGFMNAVNELRDNILGIRKATEENTNINKADLAAETESSISDINKAAGGKVDYISERKKKKKSKEERDARENAESEKARTGHKTRKEKDGTVKTEKDAIISDTIKKDKKTKETVFESVGGFFKGIFSSASSFFTNPKTWKALGLGALVVGVFGDSFRNFIEGPTGQKIVGWIGDKVPKVLSTVGDVLTKYAPQIIGTLASNIANNMGYIVDAIFKIAKSAITTVGSKGWDWIQNQFGNGDAEVHDFDGNEEAARAFAIQNGYDPEDVVDGDTVIGDHTYVDEDGDYHYVKAGSQRRKSSFAKAGYKYATSPKFRKAINKVAKYGWKGTKVAVGATLGGPVGGLIGMVPGGKIVRGVAKGGIKAADATITGASKLASKITGKAASQGGAKAAKLLETTLQEGDLILKKDANGVTRFYKGIVGKSGKIIHSKRLSKEAADGLMKTGARVVEESADGVLKAATAESKGVIGTFLKKAKDMLTNSKIIKKIQEKIPKAKWLTSVKEAFKVLEAKLLKVSGKTQSKIIKKFTEAMAKFTGRVAADAATIGLVIDAGFMVYGAVSGAMNAASLFNIKEEDVTAGMRVVSSIIETVLSTEVGIFITVINEVWKMIMGQDADFVRKFAITIYSFFGDAEQLQEDIDRMQAETDKYNAMNKTHLTKEEYNEMVNKDKTPLGQLKRGWTRVFNEKKYDEKYNYEKYELTDAEFAAWKSAKANSSVGGESVGTTDYSATTTSYQQTGSSDLINFQSDSTGYGRGPVGYGTKRQDDPRWANMPIGVFPNGETATMATAGCGPTALSMVADRSPAKVAEYAKKKGFIKDGGATEDLFTKGASDMGLTSHSLNKSSLRTALNNGESVIVSGKSAMNGPYTPASHVVVANGVDRNGNVRVSDPMRGDRIVDIESLSSGMTHGWSYGSRSYGLGLVGGAKTIGYGDTEYIDVQAPYLKRTYTKKISATKSHIYVWSRAQKANGEWEDVLIDLGSKPSSLTDGEFKRDNKIFDLSELDATDRGIKEAEYERAIKQGRVMDYSTFHYIYDGDYAKNHRKSDEITKGTISAGVRQLGNLEDYYKEGTNAVTFFDDKTEGEKTRLFFDAQGKKSKEMQKYLDSANQTRSQRAIDNWLSDAYTATNSVNGEKVKNGNTMGMYVSDVDGETLMNVADLLAIALYHPNVLNDFEIFRSLYDFYSNGKYPLSHALTANEFNSITNKDSFISQLGLTGKNGDWEMKYGFPFFQTDDTRWGSLPWGGSTISQRGTDISSLAMIASAFSPNMITPDYIKGNWININPAWLDSSGKLDMDRVFSNDKDGFNAMKAAQIDGNRLQVTKLNGTSEILTALQENKPVVLSGYRYNGGIFGGYYDANGAPMSGMDDTGTVVARAADLTHMAILDPWTTLEQSGIFDTNRLNDRVNGKSAITSAYMVTDPEGQGINGPVDLTNKEGGTSDFIDLNSVHGLDKISALLHNFGAIASHTFDSILSGTPYKSIKESNEIDGDGLDELGLENIATKDIIRSSSIDLNLDRDSEDNTLRAISGINYATDPRFSKDSNEDLSKGTYWKLVKAVNKGGVSVADSASLNEKAKKFNSLSAEEKKVINRYKDKIPLNPDTWSRVTDVDTKVLPTSDGTMYYVNKFENLNATDKKNYKCIIRYDDTGEKNPTGRTTPAKKEKKANVSSKRTLVERFFFPIKGEEGEISWSPFMGFGTGPVGGGAKDFPIGYGPKSIIDATTNPRSASKTTTGSLGAALSGVNMANTGDAFSAMYRSVTGKTKTMKSVGDMYKETKKNKIPYDSTKTNAIGDSLNENAATAIDNVVSNVTVQAGVKSADEMWQGLTLLQKLSVISQAQMAAGFGEDYETVKRQILESMALEEYENGSSTGSASIVSDNTPLTTSGKGVTLPVPEGFGKTLSYMGWQLVTSKTSNQYKLREDAGQNFDKDGLGYIGDRYTVAVKPYYGAVGDMLDVQMADGSIMKAIVADEKGHENEPGGEDYNKSENAAQRNAGVTDRVHTDGSVVEWVIDKTGGFAGYGGSKTIKKLHPEWGNGMISITNVGNYWKDGNGSTRSAIDTNTDPRFTANPKGIGLSRAVGYGVSWLDACAKVKAAIAANKPGYSQTIRIKINVDGTEMTVRPDCSGYVSACISYYTGKDFLTYTGAMLSKDAAISKYGFTRIPWTSWQSCQPGDIVVRNGHTCIFAGPTGTNNVWNCGSDSSVNNPGMTQDHSKYTYIWRLNGSVGSLSGTSYATTSVSEDTVGGSASTNSYQSPLEKMLNSMSSAYSQEVSRLSGAPVSQDGTFNIGFGRGSKGTPQEFFENTLGGITTSGYGNRSTELGNEYHRGLDISAAYGREIISPIDGVVVDAGTDVMGYGNYAVIQDTHGNNHVFAHMAAPIGYGIGSSISKNSVIGHVGSTGNSTGSHLHYEIRRSGNKYSAINPSRFKYDDSKSFNIHKANSAFEAESSAVGTGNKDLSTQIEDKLNVAVNTDNIEDKMDSIISVLGLMANGITDISKAKPATSNTFNTTTVYGKGSDGTKTVITRPSNSTKTKSGESMTLLEYHKQMTSKS